MNTKVEGPDGGAPARCRVVAWVPVALWMAAILFLSGPAFSAEHTGGWLRSILGVLVPSLEPACLEIIDWILRKFAHLVEYAVLGALNARALSRGRTRRESGATALAAIGLAVLWAIVDETRQSFVGSRTGSAWDVLLDAAGAAAGAFLHRRGRQRFMERQAKAPPRRPD